MSSRGLNVKTCNKLLTVDVCNITQNTAEAENTDQRDWLVQPYVYGLSSAALKTHKDFSSNLQTVKLKRASSKGTFLCGNHTKHTTRLVYIDSLINYTVIYLYIYII